MDSTPPGSPADLLQQLEANLHRLGELKNRITGACAHELEPLSRPLAQRAQALSQEASQLLRLLRVKTGRWPGKDAWASLVSRWW